MQFVSKYILITLLFIIFNSFVFSQSDNKNIKKIIDYTEQAYGINNTLVSGKLYYPLHYGIEGHPFLISNDFTLANVYINNQVFKGVPIKYDLEQQKMILNISSKSSNKNIELIPNRIDSIVFEKRTFLYSEKLPELPQNDNYYELIWNQGFKFFTHHHISFNPTKNKQLKTKGGYSDIVSSNYININNKLYSANSKRSFLKAFKPIKKDVTEFLRVNRIKYKKINVHQQKELMKFCYEKSAFN